MPIGSLFGKKKEAVPMDDVPSIPGTSAEAKALRGIISSRSGSQWPPKKYQPGANDNLADETHDQHKWASYNFKQGERVDVWYNGAWHPAQITKVGHKSKSGTIWDYGVKYDYKWHGQTLGVRKKTIRPSQGSPEITAKPRTRRHAGAGRPSSPHLDSSPRKHRVRVGLETPPLPPLDSPGLLADEATPIPRIKLNPMTVNKGNRALLGIISSSSGSRFIPRAARKKIQVVDRELGKQRKRVSQNRTSAAPPWKPAAATTPSAPGPAPSSPERDGNGLLFSGGRDTNQVLDDDRVAPPALKSPVGGFFSRDIGNEVLPGGFQRGDVVRTLARGTLVGGLEIQLGDRGTVVGLAKDRDGNELEVKFGAASKVGSAHWTYLCLDSQWGMMEKGVWSMVAGAVVSDGTNDDGRAEFRQAMVVISRKQQIGVSGKMLRIGDEGTVVGPAPPCREGRIAVDFESSGRWDVLPHEIMPQARWCEPLAGDFMCGQTVRSIIEWFGGPIQLHIGDQGIITGCVPNDTTSVRVEYVEAGGNVDHFPEQIVEEGEWGKELNGGWHRGDAVCAKNNLHGETGELRTGDHGTVVGPGSQAAEDWNQKVRVYFGDGAWWTLWPEEIMAEDDYDTDEQSVTDLHKEQAANLKLPPQAPDIGVLVQRLERTYGAAWIQGLYSHLTRIVVPPLRFMDTESMRPEDQKELPAPHLKSNQDYIRQVLDIVSHTLQYGLEQHNGVDVNAEIDKMVDGGRDEVYCQLSYCKDHPGLLHESASPQTVDDMLGIFQDLQSPDHKVLDCAVQNVDHAFQASRVFLQSFQPELVARMQFGMTNLIQVQSAFDMTIKLRGDDDAASGL